MSRDERKAMIVPDRPGLSLSRQCRLLSISRSSFYYAPRGESPENLVLAPVGPCTPRFQQQATLARPWISPS